MHFFPIPLKNPISLVKQSLLDVALAFWPMDWLQEALKSFLPIPVPLLSQIKWFISGGFQSVMHMDLLSCLLPHLSCKHGSCTVMCLLCNVSWLGCAFPSTDVWSLVSPARGLMLSASLSISSDAFSSVCWSPRDLTKTCAVYWWLCWPTTLHTPGISELQLWAVKAELNSGRQGLWQLLISVQ